MKKLTSLILLGVLASSFLTGCYNNSKTTILSPMDSSTPTLDFDFAVEPNTFALTIEVDGITENVSEALPLMEVSNLESTDSSISWSYPTINVMESLSMQFFSVTKANYALT